jgi:hypothetical protein
MHRLLDPSLREGGLADQDDPRGDGYLDGRLNHRKAIETIDDNEAVASKGHDTPAGNSVSGIDGDSGKGKQVKPQQLFRKKEGGESSL